MAVSPSQCGQLSNKEQKQVKDLEEKIDEHLQTKYEGEQVWFCVGRSYPGRRVIQAIRDMYDAAGWTMRVEEDQRDPGIFFVFSEKKHGKSV